MLRQMCKNFDEILAKKKVAQRVVSTVSERNKWRMHCNEDMYTRVPPSFIVIGIDNGHASRKVHFTNNASYVKRVCNTHCVCMYVQNK